MASNIPNAAENKVTSNRASISSNFSKLFDNLFKFKLNTRRAPRRGADDQLTQQRNTSHEALTPQKSKDDSAIVVGGRQHRFPPKSTYFRHSKYSTDSSLAFDDSPTAITSLSATEASSSDCLASGDHFDLDLVEWCISEIEKADVTSLKGIYRISGNALTIARLEKSFARQEIPDFDVDLYSVADLLKRHIRSRSTALFEIGNVQSEIIKAGALSEHVKLAELTQIVKHLPEDRYKIGRMLFHHLAQIASYEASTKMTASNLATFWAPNLFAVSHGDSKDNHGRHRGKKVTSKNCSKIISEASMDISGMISVAEFIIRHSKTIFPVDE